MLLKEMTEDNTINIQSCSKEISGLRAKLIVAWVKGRYRWLGRACSWKLNGKKTPRLALICQRKFGFLFTISICIVDTFSVISLYVRFLRVSVLLSAVYVHGPSRYVAPNTWSIRRGIAQHSRKSTWCFASLLPLGTGPTASPAAWSLALAPCPLPRSTSHESGSVGPRLCPGGSPSRAAAGALRAGGRAGGFAREADAPLESCSREDSCQGQAPWVALLPSCLGTPVQAFPSPPVSSRASFPSPPPLVLTAGPEVLHPLCSLLAGSPHPPSIPKATCELDASSSHPEVPSLPWVGAFCVHSFASKSKEDKRSKAGAPWVWQ